MADLTASGSTPAVHWDDTDHGGVDWKMIADGAISLQQYWSMAYRNRMRWSQTEVVSYVEVSSSTPSSLATFNGTSATIHSDAEIEGTLSLTAAASQIRLLPPSAAEFQIQARSGGHLEILDSSGSRQFVQVTASTSAFGLYKNTGSTSARQFDIDPRDGSADCHVRVGLGDDTRGKVSILRDPRYGNERAGILCLQSEDDDSVLCYLWLGHETSGGNRALRCSLSDPGMNDTAGTILVVF